jgi:inhibitor of KinA
VSEELDPHVVSGTQAGLRDPLAPLLPAEIVPLGDAAILVGFGDRIDSNVFAHVRALAEYLDTHPLPGLIEYVPAYAALALFYDPLRWSFPEFCTEVRRIVAGLPVRPDAQPRTVEIPVCYGGDFGPDLALVAQHNRLTEAEVVSIHTDAEYLTYMIGFAPGFPYLGGMSPRIAAPRHRSPRVRVPAGSVGIAGTQTGIYSLETPGGWQLIGRTPRRLFRPWEDPPSLLRAGDRVRFRRITPREFAAWQEERC